MANDVSALRHDPNMIDLVAARGCPLVLMHAPGSGDDLHAEGNYTNVVFDVFDWLAARRDEAVAAGIARERVRSLIRCHGLKPEPNPMATQCAGCESMKRAAWELAA